MGNEFVLTFAGLLSGGMLAGFVAVYLARARRRETDGRTTSVLVEAAGDVVVIQRDTIAHLRERQDELENRLNALESELERTRQERDMARRENRQLELRVSILTARVYELEQQQK